jgi:hypothetical protein
MGIPRISHGYDVADFSKYYYWQVYFQSAGVYNIGGNILSGTTGLVLDLRVSSKPTYISGGYLYLMGDNQPYLGPNPVSGTTLISGDAVDAGGTFVPTDYYYGNLGMGGSDVTRVFN